MSSSHFYEGRAAIVGIGEYCIGQDPMATIGLGSCVALILYDPQRAFGSMAHVMLPDSHGRTDRPGKYADTAVPLLVDGMVGKGCRRQKVVAKLVGGASMFAQFSGNLNIGDRNTRSLKSLLDNAGIRVVAELTGGNVGRSVVFTPLEGGRVTVKRADGTCCDL
ncbi:Chemoreceptor glutamine deamidase CheD [anaerobic digester metagenome]